MKLINWRKKCKKRSRQYHKAEKQTLSAEANVYILRFQISLPYPKFKICRIHTLVIKCLITPWVKNTVRPHGQSSTPDNTKESATMSYSHTITRSHSQALNQTPIFTYGSFNSTQMCYSKQAQEKQVPIKAQQHLRKKKIPSCTNTRLATTMTRQGSLSISFFKDSATDSAGKQWMKHEIKQCNCITSVAGVSASQVSPTNLQTLQDR